jgi:hypothetical protein
MSDQFTFPIFALVWPDSADPFTVTGADGQQGIILFESIADAEDFEPEHGLTPVAFPSATALAEWLDEAWQALSASLVLTGRMSEATVGADGRKTVPPVVTQIPNFLDLLKRQAERDANASSN